MGREGVPVGHEEEAFVFLLKLEPVREGAEIMSEVEAAGRPHTAEDSLGGWFALFHALGCLRKIKI